jgi:hypothetical protein
MYISTQCSKISQKVLTFGRFPGFTRLFFWYEQHVDESENSWNDTDRGKPKQSQKNLSKSCFVHHQTHMD